MSQRKKKKKSNTCTVTGDEPAEKLDECISENSEHKCGSKKKKKTKEQAEFPVCSTDANLLEEHTSTLCRKRKKKRRHSQSPDRTGQEDYGTNECDHSLEKTKTVKKKKRKESDKQLDTAEPVVEIHQTGAAGQEDTVHRKKKKKKKKSGEESEPAVEVLSVDSKENCENLKEVITEDAIIEDSSPKKKKKKRSVPVEESELCTAAVDGREGHVDDNIVAKDSDRKKKKKKKNKNTIEDDKVELEESSGESQENGEHSKEAAREDSPKKIKKKKKKHDTIKERELDQVVEDAGSVVNGKKKHKKKQETQDMDGTENGATMHESKSKLGKNKKKKQSKKSEENEGQRNDAVQKGEENYSRKRSGPAEKMPEPARLGQWGSASFDSSERQNKFLRLMGAFKTPSNDGPKSSSSLSTKFNSALDNNQASTLNDKLERQYEQAMNFRLDSNRFGGLGYEKPPEEGKKFYIDTSKSKSKKFDE